MSNHGLQFLNALKTTIYNLRNIIDKIDTSILDLVNFRLELVEKIGQLKQEGGWCIDDSIRENEILSRLNHLNNGVLESDDLHSIFSHIINASRRLQKKKRIAYIASESIISDIVTSKYFNRKKTLYKPFFNELEVFIQVGMGFCDYGLLPVDFSSISNFSNFFLIFKFKICAEYFIKVNYELVAKHTNLKRLHTVYVCKNITEEYYNWLKKSIPNVNIVNYDCIMDAISLVSNNERLAIVMLEGTAIFFGLKLVISSTGIVKSSLKRYLVICNNDLRLPDRNKTSVFCNFPNTTVKLMKFLCIFNDVNVSSIEIEQCSYGHSEKNSLFLINFNGHSNDKQFELALADLYKYFLWIQELGTYPVIDGEMFVDD